MQSVGGQAVIEGVMMRCGNKLATAVRTPKGIKIKKETMNPVSKKYPFLAWPFFRGVVNMAEMMVIGIRTLEWSAHQAAGEEEEISKRAMTITIIIAFAAGIFLFMLMPYFFTYVVGLTEQQHPIGFNLVDGLFKLIILIAYIAAIGLMPDIKRLFQYHGAEHKAVACHEHKKKLTPKNCRQYSTAHARCGTSFLLLVVLVGVALFSFVPVIMFRIIPGLQDIFAPLRYATLMIARLLLLPVIAGVAYEFLKFSGAHSEKWYVKPFIWPGLAVQKLTTRPPTDNQVEVAIKAIKAVI